MNLILDMDGTLIDGFYNDYNEVIIKKRPFLKLFFKFVFNNFDNVSIWTNANFEWFNIIYENELKYLIPEGKSFDFVKTRETSITYPLKDLEIIYIDSPQYNENNTFIIDDCPETYQKNISNSIPIEIYNYEYEQNISKIDTELLRIIKLFENKLFL
jgi:hypothetical protein